MTLPYKPQGYTSVSVYMVADGVQRVIDFLTEAFAAEVLRRYDNPDGSIMHAEVQLDDSVVMIADADSPFPVWLHVYAPYVDASYQRALDGGGVSVGEPSEEDGIDRRVGVKDPAGNTWWLATQVGRL